MSAAARTAEASRAATAELIGDGSTLDAATFAGLGLGARNARFRANPERYRELRDKAEKAEALKCLGSGR